MIRSEAIIAPGFTHRLHPGSPASAISLIVVAKSSEKQRPRWLFFIAANRREPSVSAANAMSFADNFLQKQQKQRDLPPIR
jgi:hypothetical protein